MMDGSLIFFSILFFSFRFDGLPTKKEKTFDMCDIIELSVLVKALNFTHDANFLSYGIVKPLIAY
jgi:hypothetical protein